MENENVRTRSRHVLRKTFFMFLIMAMIVTAAIPVQAAGEKWTGLADGDILIKDTITKIADGVYEHEVVTNNEKGDNQKIDYLSEVEMSDSIKIVSGYGQDNGEEWSLTSTTDQAKAYMKNHPGETVVSGINADFFNMGTGEPLGALVMEGKAYHSANGRYYFGITKDGKPVIRNSADLSDLQSAVGGDALLINNGQIMTENTAYGELHYSRTGIGIKEDGTVITFVTYGNRAPVSCGRTYLEMAEMLKNAGCVYALALDGGGSSTLISRPEGTSNLELRNHPVDGAERQVSSSLLIVSTKEATGVFSHAQLSPNNEVYTPNSKVQFEANGVDTAGMAMDLPGGTTWAVAEECSDMGTIDAKTGIFTANEKTGVVTINLLKDGKQVGETSIEIVVPDSIYFATDEVSLGFEEESDLGLVVRSKGRDVHYKDGDIKWDFKYNDEYIEKGPGTKASVTIGGVRIDAKNGGTYGNKVSIEFAAVGGVTKAIIYVDNEQKESFDVAGGSIAKLVKLQSAYVDFYAVGGGGDSITLQEKTPLTGGKEPTLSDIGEFKNNIFTSKNATAKGVTKATSAYDDKVSGEIKMIVGMLPTVVWDFEDVTLEDGSTVSAKDYYVNGYTNGTETKSGLLSTSNYGRGGKQSIEVVNIDEDEPVRFGQNSLKLNYDFTQCGEVTEGACIGTTTAMQIPGVPTGIGVWVYAPEGVGVKWEGTGTQAGFWLRGYVKDGTGSTVPYDFTLEPKVIEAGSDQQPGIYWEGWKYLEADLTKLQAPYSIQQGMTFRLMFVNGTKMGTRTANSIYFDNLQFVYGTNVDDIDNPVINSITVNGKELAEDDVIETNVVNIDSIVSDVQNKHTSGIDESTIRMYIDGVNVVDNDKYEYQYADSIAHLYNLKLKDGSHSVTVSLRDNFGNETSETRNFVIDTKNVDEDTNVKVVANGDAILGGTLDLQIKASDANVKTNTTSFKLGNQFKEYDVIFSDNYEGTAKYSKLNKTINVDATRKEAAAAEDDNVIATLRVKIPADLLEGDEFTYAIKSGEFTTLTGYSDTYSSRTIKMPVKAGYNISVDPIIVGGEDGVIKVTDADGKAAANVGVYLVDGNQELGKTDEEGKLVTKQFNTNAGEYKVYAKDDGGKLSFQYKLQSYAPQGDTAGVPHNIRFNTVKDATTQENITWMSNPLTEGKQVIQYAVKGSDSWTTVEATTSQEEFETKGYNVVNVNKVLLKGLTPGTTYEYKVGTGEAMSEVKTFTTDTENRTNSKFFILGDIQDPDKTNLETIVDRLKSEKNDFGIQIGDAIDQANDYTDWAELGDILGEKKLNDTKMISIMGNHEYYGDGDASIASAIYNNDTTESGTYYSVEYGNIYLAVINFCDNTDQINKAAKWLVKDAEKSNATWKILLTHQPPYFTNSTGGNDPVYKALPDACEEAGIDAVFSGHDHSLARTNLLRDDKIDTENGIVYYLTGAIGSKRYPITTQGQFDYDTIFYFGPDKDYKAAYLTVESDNKEMVIKMYTLDKLEEVFTIKSKCEKDDHKCLYDPKTGEVACRICKEKFENYTGDAVDKDGNEYNLIAGKMSTGWITVGEEYRYYNEKGIREKVTKDVTPSTCTIDGWCYHTSESGAVKYERYNDAKGHEFEKKDGEDVCSVCGWKLIQMEDCTVKLSFNSCTYSGNQKKPLTTVKNPEGKTLDKGKYVDEYRTKYSDNVEIGTATVEVRARNKAGYTNINEWRGSYYGSQKVTFDICPDAPKNAAVYYEGTTANLSWDAAKYAEKYVIYQSTNGGKWKKVATTKNCKYKLKGLSTSKKYSYRVKSVAKGLDVKGKKKDYESKYYVSAKRYKPILKVSYNKDGKPVIKWKRADGVKYTVYRATTKDGTYKKIYTTTKGSQVTNTSAKAGKSYYYKVKAHLKGRYVGESTIVKATAKSSKAKTTSKK